MWQSPDPILARYLLGTGSGHGIFTPPNLNLFGYVHQRPIIAFDPNGRETLWSKIRAFVPSPFVASDMQANTVPFERDDGTQGNTPFGAPDSIGTAATRFSLMHHNGSEIFTPEFGDKTTPGGDYTAGSTNAVRHVSLAALAANRYSSDDDRKDVWRILRAHEDFGDFDPDGPKTGFATGTEADFTADMLNNQDGMAIAAACNECSNKDVMMGVAEHGRNTGFWQVRTLDDGTKEVYRSRLTQGQYNAMVSEINRRDEYGTAPE